MYAMREWKCQWWINIDIEKETADIPATFNCHGSVYLPFITARAYSSSPLLSLPCLLLHLIVNPLQNVTMKILVKQTWIKVKKEEMCYNTLNHDRTTQELLLGGGLLSQQETCCQVIQLNFEWN